MPAGSIGYLLPGTEARITLVAEPDADGGHDDVSEGELWVRGPQIMVGYLDAPEATAAALSEHGWLRTGDLVRVDASGAFFVVDRLKELIKYKGHQVAPAELEALLLTHPQIRDVGVVGVPDQAAGEIPKAFVVHDGSLDTQQLMAWVAARVAPHKRIRAVESVAAIPRSPAGKILRRMLRG